MNTQTHATDTQWALAQEARQLTDRIGLRLREVHRRDPKSPERERLSNLWHKALRREMRRYRIVNPPYTPGSN